MSGGFLRKRGCPLISNEKNMQLFISFNWDGSAREGRQYLTIAEQRWIVRFQAAPNIDNSFRCSSIVKFCKRKVMISSDALPCLMIEHTTTICYYSEVILFIFFFSWITKHSKLDTLEKGERIRIFVMNFPLVTIVFFLPFLHEI